MFAARQGGKATFAAAARPNSSEEKADNSDSAFGASRLTFNQLELGSRMWLWSIMIKYKGLALSALMIVKALFALPDFGFH